MSENHSRQEMAVRVRPAREGDLEAVAAIMVAGFRAKFEAALAERVDRAERIVARSLALEAPRGLPGLYVAEVNLPTASGGASEGQTLLPQQRPAAIRGGDSQEKAGLSDPMSQAALTWPFTPGASAGAPRLFPVDGRVVGTIALRRQSDPYASDWDASGILFDELGLWGGLRAMFYFSLLDQGCKRDEVYVSDVAVAPDMRRQGIGAALVRHADKVAREWGKKSLILDVTAGNTEALHLYERMGYTEERRRRPLLARWLLKEREWVRMRKMS